MLYALWKATQNIKIFKKKFLREFYKNRLKHPHSNFEIDQDFFPDFMSYAGILNTIMKTLCTADASMLVTEFKDKSTIKDHLTH